MKDPQAIPLLVAGLIIFAGYLGSVFFQKTKIPDILILVLIGVIIGPVAKWVEWQHLSEITPYFVTLALIIVLFEGGLHLDFNMFYKNFGYAMFLGVGIFVLSIGVIFVIFKFLLPAAGMAQMSGTAAILLGGILGGTSSEIVIFLVRSMKVSADTRTNIELESVLTDIFVVLVVVVTADIALMGIGKVEVSSIFNKLAGSFAIAIVVAFITGLIWVAALRVLQKTPLAYMTTLAMAVVLYAIVQSAQASGPIAVFTFGMVLRNADRFLRILDVHEPFALDEKIETFHAEWTFFIRTYFFVLLGLFCTPDKFTQEAIIYGLIAFGCILVARVIGLLMFNVINKKEKPYFTAYLALMSRGLAPAIMAGVPASLLISRPEHKVLYDQVSPFISYTIVVVLLSNLFTVIGVFISERQQSLTQ